MEGRKEGAGKESGKHTLERGAGAKGSLAKDLQKSLWERKLKAESYSERLRCVHVALRRQGLVVSSSACSHQTTQVVWWALKENSREIKLFSKL